MHNLKDYQHRLVNPILRGKLDRECKIKNNFKERTYRIVLLERRRNRRRKKSDEKKRTKRANQLNEGNRE